MADIQRISAQQAHAKSKANQALLVCAYEDEAKCRMLNLTGPYPSPACNPGRRRCRRHRKSSSIERDRAKRVLSVRQRNIESRALPTSRC